MTSTNGIQWQNQVSSANVYWTSVTYGNGLFVAVSSDGSNRVMTSPNGIVWTNRLSPNNNWSSVIYRP